MATRKYSDIRISDLTVGELLDILDQHLKVRSPRYVRGIEGIAELFGVSISTAKRIKASGVIDKAVSQSGRVIVTDAELAMDLYARATHGRTNSR